jgi:hypothetical protein
MVGRREEREGLGRRRPVGVGEREERKLCRIV